MDRGYSLCGHKELDMIVNFTHSQMSQNPNIELLGQYQFHPPSLSNDTVYLRFQRKKDLYLCFKSLQNADSF